MNRDALLLRLLNSPADSLQHLALATLVLLKSEWVTATMNDVNIILPGIKLVIGTSQFGPIVSSTHRWSDAVEWLSAQPQALQFNSFGIYGRRCRAPTYHSQSDGESKIARRHIQRIAQQLRQALHRQSDTNLVQRLAHRDAQDTFAKTQVLYARICAPGPPLHLSPD